MEGRLAHVRRAGDVASRDDVTCELDENLEDVLPKVRAEEKEECIVVVDGTVVLGRLSGNALNGDPNARVEDVMEAGPTTIRPNMTLGPVVERLQTRKVNKILVTTSDGRLVGTLHLSDAEQQLEKAGPLAEKDEASCECQE